MTQKKNNIRTVAIVTASLFSGIVIGQVLPANAQVGEILKGAAIGVLVNQFGGQIDRFVNTLTGNKPDGLRETTRVVPILTVGEGAYVGAAQITGPKNKVDVVKALARVEGSTRIGNELRATALIPISTARPGKLESLSRVKGVGVSAIIDYRLGL